MSKWIDQCESILTGLGLPYDFVRFKTDKNHPQPDIYIVYFLVDDNGISWSDGKETGHEPHIQVSLFYRNEPDFLIYPDLIDKAFSDAGFMLGSAGNIPYQPDTGHYGWRRDLYFYERRDMNV